MKSLNSSFTFSNPSLDFNIYIILILTRTRVFLLNSPFTSSLSLGCRLLLPDGWHHFLPVRKINVSVPPRKGGSGLRGLGRFWMNQWLLHYITLLLHCFFFFRMLLISPVVFITYVLFSRPELWWLQPVMFLCKDFRLYWICPSISTWNDTCLHIIYNLVYLVGPHSMVGTLYACWFPGAVRFRQQKHLGSGYAKIALSGTLCVSFLKSWALFVNLAAWYRVLPSVLSLLSLGVWEENNHNHDNHPF